MTQQHHYNASVNSARNSFVHTITGLYSAAVEEAEQKPVKSNVIMERCGNEVFTLLKQLRKDGEPSVQIAIEALQTLLQHPATKSHTFEKLAHEIFKYGDANAIEDFFALSSEALLLANIDYINKLLKVCGDNEPDDSPRLQAINTAKLTVAAIQDKAKEPGDTAEPDATMTNKSPSSGKNSFS